jgi:apolipoprotein N-acyltransferase
VPLRSVAAAVATVASAIGFFASSALHPWWPTAWLAPVFVGALALRASPIAAFSCAFVARFVGGFALYSYFNGVLGMPAPVTIVVFGAPAIVFGLYALLIRALARRVSAAWTTMLGAAFLAGADHLRAVTSVHGTFGSEAYSQIEALPIARIASIGGLPMIVLVMTAASTAIAISIARVGSIRDRAAALAVAAAVVAGSVAMPILAGANTASQRPTTKVALLASDNPPFPIDASDPTAVEAIDRYARAIEALADEHPDVVVLPETIVAVTDAEWPAFSDRFATLARRLGSTIVVGVDRRSANVEANQAVAFVPALAVPVTYAKHHLLPPFENRYTRGEVPMILATSRGLSEQGVAICKDLDFPAWSRRYGAAHIGLMLAPAWDFGVDGWLHSRMATMRAIEEGFALARSARGGRLTVSDNTGAIVAETTSDSAPIATLVATVATGARVTIYSRIGGDFGWGCVAGMVFAVGVGVFARRVRAVGG